MEKNNESNWPFVVLVGLYAFGFYLWLLYVMALPPVVAILIVVIAIGVVNGVFDYAKYKSFLYSLLSFSAIFVPGGGYLFIAVLIFPVIEEYFIWTIPTHVLLTYFYRERVIQPFQKNFLEKRIEELMRS